MDTLAAYHIMLALTHRRHQTVQDYILVTRRRPGQVIWVARLSIHFDPIHTPRRIIPNAQHFAVFARLMIG